MATVELTDLDAGALPAEELEAVYRGTFTGQPPYYEGEDGVGTFRGLIPELPDLPGFRIALARADGELVGFAYGYAAVPGQSSPDNVRAQLSREDEARWFADAFWLGELALLPSHHGQGLGGRLHDAVVYGAPHSTAMSITYQGDTPAVGMYEKRGWVELARDASIPGFTNPWIVIGLELPT